MKATIVNCFETNEPRVRLVYDYFIEKGYEVSVIQSNFMHINKLKRNDSVENFTFIDTLPYYKNISIARIKSHYIFSKKSFELVESIKPDVIYVILPPNSMAKFASDYKKKNKAVKLYFDIMDLWPETMPMNNIKFLFPISIWRNLRNKNLISSDFVITECDLYQNVLGKVLKKCKTSTLYLAKNENKIEGKLNINENEINLCYLGSINNIIDISKIKQVISALNSKKSVVFHIIGDGEKRDIFINEIKKTGAKVIYYGKIYDVKQKLCIFNKCNFGINIMKDSVCVGLTMKSIDYFQYGLPIINNIKFDTERIVERYNIGFNIDESNIEEVVKNINKMNSKDIVDMRLRTHKVFEKYFSKEAFNQKFKYIMEASDESKK